MSVASIGFLFSFALFAVIFTLRPFPSLRRLLFVLANLAFLAQMTGDPTSLLAPIVFVLVTYLILLWIKPRASLDHMIAVIVLVVLGFVYVKRYPIADVIFPGIISPSYLCRDLEIVGLSYMLFKFIHVLVDLCQGQLDEMSLMSYANYQLGFFTLMAGPINRYNDFKRFWDTMGIGAVESRGVLVGWSRILAGMFKMAVLAPYFLQAYEDASHAIFKELPHAPWAYPIVFYCFPVYLYLNFSGYTDIMVGCAALLGYALPENFNRPYLARNIIDFWQRWHISLTNFVRDYIFTPMYMLGAQKIPTMARWIGYAAMFVTLFVVGMWHGNTMGFVVFGLIHGAGVVAAQAYSDLLRKWLGPAGVVRYTQNIAIRLVAIVVCFHVVCFSFVYFSSGTYIAGILFRNFGRELRQGMVWDWTAWSTSEEQSLLMAALVVILFSWPPQGLPGFVRRMQDRLTAHPQWLNWKVFTQTLVVVFSLLWLWALQFKDPIVAYQKF